MKKFLASAVAILASAYLLGCGATAKETQRKAESSQTDIFTEISDGEPIPKGFADLTIEAKLKTHVEGYYILESRESLHGKQAYPFLFNIDGQAVQWKVDGVKDIKPVYEGEGRTSRDPEAREGVKYVLSKKVRLAAGAHKVFFGLPEENCYTEFDITLTEGETSMLELRPVYRYKTHPTRIPTFLKGIERYEVFLNGKLEAAAD
jgi:hypothetical protein